MVWSGLCRAGSGLRGDGRTASPSPSHTGIPRRRQRLSVSVSSWCLNPKSPKAASQRSHLSRSPFSQRVNHARGNCQQLCPAERWGRGEEEGRGRGGVTACRVHGNQVISERSGSLFLPRLKLIKPVCGTRWTRVHVRRASAGPPPNRPAGRPRRSPWPPRLVRCARSGFSVPLAYEHPACFESTVRKNFRVDVPERRESHTPGINPLPVLARGHFTTLCVKRKKKRRNPFKRLQSALRGVLTL